AFLASFANLAMETFVLKRNGTQNMERLVDFHTVGGGYADSDKFNIPRTAENKPGRTILSYREYLLDARFGVLLSGDTELIHKFDDALRNPVWGIWFGRKCCIPASPVTQGICETSEEALQQLCKLAGCDLPSLRIREVDSYADGTDSLSDVPITFERHCRGMGNEFTSRRIVIEHYNTSSEKETNARF
ncbi:MAG: type I-E CRISPR-associated protein Cas5/CasD, partial [Planctomycetia bacterium]|nr:type I-E CRISPR-associated protein Cas5/CasD [Planctomycetia bacterium]